MKHLLKNFPISLSVIAIICYLSFFKPPETDMEDIPYFDKIVHLCMYGGLTCVIWTEYFWHYQSIRLKDLCIRGILFPICMSGAIEILQETCTTNRSGDWYDFIANCIGVILASVFGRYIIIPTVRRYQSQHKKTPNASQHPKSGEKRY